MPAKLEGLDQSLWVATTPETDYPTLTGDDAAVYELAQRGKRVALLERGHLAEWTTGGTTAKLSSQHYLIYDYLIEHQGEAIAREFGQANERGIARVETLSAELGIDCEFARRSAYVFTQTGEKIEEMKAEVAAATKLGLPASFETTIDLPFAITGAVKFADQAQFHPRKFLLGLAEQFVAVGGVIYEHTNATGVETGPERHTVTTDAGSVRAVSVVQASGEPFWKRELFDGFMWLKMSYALGVKLRSGEYPGSMYITTDTPMRTIRTASYEGEPIMIFGGESHEYDEATYDEATYDEDAHYRALIEDVRRRFDVERVALRWLAGDFMPYDRMPYIGALPRVERVYVATGYRAWGLAWAMSVAEAIAEEISGRAPAWVEPFSTARLAHPIPKEEQVHGF